MTGTVHACPPGGSSATPCCDRRPFGLPRADRITVDPALVTCEGRADMFGDTPASM